MSSHHIVREKQEPALLVLGLDDFSDEQLGQLLEWSPTVIVTELIAERLNAYGIKVDWVIADNLDDIQSDIKFLPLNGNAVINTAFDFLLANNYPSVNVVTDEFNLADYLQFADKINLVIFYNQQKIYAIHSGFSKWKPAGEVIELLSTPQSLAVTGLKQVKQNTFITTADGVISISFEQPFLFIAESL